MRINKYGDAHGIQHTPKTKSAQKEYKVPIDLGCPNPECLERRKVQLLRRRFDGCECLTCGTYFGIATKLERLFDEDENTEIY